MAKASKTAPAHLRETTRLWFDTVVTEFQLEPHHVRLLTLAAEAWDRTQEARERLEVDGSYIEDRFGQLKAHPAILVEQNSRIAFARLLRDLALDVDTPAEEYTRPPASAGARKLKVG